jgi:hypothetical protein
MTIATHENGKWTVTTGPLTTVFCTEEAAATQIGILQQEILRLRNQLPTSHPTRAAGETCPADGATPSGCQGAGGEL